MEPERFIMSLVFVSWLFIYSVINIIVLIRLAEYDKCNVKSHFWTRLKIVVNLLLKNVKKLNCIKLLHLETLYLFEILRSYVFKMCTVLKVTNPGDISNK